MSDVKEKRNSFIWYDDELAWLSVILKALNFDGEHGEHLIGDVALHDIEGEIGRFTTDDCGQWYFEHTKKPVDATTPDP